MLRDSAFVFTNLWLEDAVQRVLHPALPQLRNTDGDEYVIMTITYPLQGAAGIDAIGRALSAIPRLRQEGETFWNWIEPPRRAGPKAMAAGQTLITTLNDGSSVLATIEVKDRLLVLGTNSRRRADKARALIEPVLGRLIGAPHVEAQTVTQLMASRPADSSKVPPSKLSPDEEHAIIHASLDRHYAAVLDEPVPSLGNVSPRRAARTAKGRERLVEWLKFLENQTAGQPAGSAMADYDFNWLWKALGVADRRR